MGRDSVTGPERRLAAAVLERAVRDAQAGDALARRWLERSPEAGALLDVLGLHRDRARAFVDRLDPPPQAALPGL
jgi:hypothetical protein